MSPSDVPANIQSLVENAKDLFDKSFSTDPIEGFIHVSTAPGRVNLIGEHTDYTGGYVLPLAIGYGTVCYGRGSIVKRTNGDMKCRVVSMNNPQDVVEFEADPSSVPSVTNKWTNYVQGVVLQYLADLKGDEIFSFDMAIAGDVPLGSGLSSSASLEVATAVFLEALMRESGADALSMKGDRERKKDRAVRCQRAENVFCNVPCGIMVGKSLIRCLMSNCRLNLTIFLFLQDQFVSSAGCQGKLLLIDCRSLDVREVAMGMDNTGCKPVLVVTNSNVQHNLGDSEYPIRVKQCKEATERLALVNSSILSLRDAAMDDIAAASSKGLLDKVLLQRARHVVSENKRTEDTACALEKGDWSRVGQLMNESHTSMKDDYEVSCKEIDILVELAQGFEGVYGSRLTGGGFGGCTVTLVREDSSQRLIDYLKEQYKEKIGTDCTCFKTTPSEGARELHI
ncbi:hypothetical protein HJC23_005066 [Cyclotella cryptica]|uniref:Galactokinase n=1 Tax=Cyclotella cryptica TaxID=29204 RepID=A0ABD3QDF7_9STRA